MVSSGTLCPLVHTVTILLCSVVHMVTILLCPMVRMIAIISCGLYGYHSLIAVVNMLTFCYVQWLI